MLPQRAFETADSTGRPTSRSIIQLSPSSVLGGLRGMLSPSGNAKISFRSRAYFLFYPAAIIEFGNGGPTRSSSRCQQQKRKTLANFHTLSDSSTVVEPNSIPRHAYCAFISNKLVQVVISLV